jgi:arabinan endo-1,5-alpha-L-arabinosidase
MKPDDLQVIGEWLAGDKEATHRCAQRAGEDPDVTAEARQQVRLHLLLRAALLPRDARVVARRAMVLASSESSRRLRVRRIVRTARGQPRWWSSPWLIAASLLLTIMGSLVAWPAAVSVGELAPGAVLLRAGVETASAAGQRVRAGDQVDAVAGTALVFHDGTALTLATGARMQVIAAQGWLSTAAKTLFLQEGSLHAEVAHQPNQHPLTIATPEVLVTVRGTVFTLTVSSGLTVCAVESGRVSVSHAGETREVSGGQQVRCGHDGFLDDAPAAAAAALPPDPAPLTVLPLRGNTVPVANPEVIVADQRFFLFSQGPGISLRTSEDLLTWSDPRRVFTRDPAWWTEASPQYRIWSPAVASWGGSYWLYYVVTGPEPSDSLLGLATATSLKATQNSETWTDRGPILRLPRHGSDGIGDPQIILDPEGRPWLLMGSGDEAGVTIRPLDQASGRIVPEPEIRSLARGHLAQAPFVFRHGDYYYLFFATEHYRTTFSEAVGRSRSLLGPYVDRQSVALVQGGRTIVTRGTNELIAPANACVVSKDGQDFLVTNAFHPPAGPLLAPPAPAADPSAAAGTPGERHLVICPITWDRDGWPVTALTPQP